ncbi:hypothetical protein [Streptomyces sp. NPDC058247]|uniref:hypothetical protein n=1 Tax=Streptomyces sp. NPDC058247 TaxID=3346401 RepID=UPI0036F166E7
MRGQEVAYGGTRRVLARYEDGPRLEMAHALDGAGAARQGPPPPLPREPLLDELAHPFRQLVRVPQRRQLLARRAEFGLVALHERRTSAVSNACHVRK